MLYPNEKGGNFSKIFLSDYFKGFPDLLVVVQSKHSVVVAKKRKISKYQALSGGGICILINKCISVLK